jgi:hypothetical protein
VFEGCDTTSAFHGKGKLKPWQVLMQHPKFAPVFARLGNLPIDDDIEESLNEFVCLLYGDTISKNVDECRYNIINIIFICQI